MDRSDTINFFPKLIKYFGSGEQLQYVYLQQICFPTSICTVSVNTACDYVNDDSLEFTPHLNLIIEAFTSIMHINTLKINTNNIIIVM